MINGVGRNNKRGIGFEEIQETPKVNLHDTAFVYCLKKVQIK